MKPRITLRHALSDPLLLGGILDGSSWLPWRSLLLASMGEALLDDERRLFTELTHREREPLAPVEEFVGVIGRRGGKSRAISVLAAYVAGLCDHPTLVKGERGVLLIIAPDLRQADIVLGYIVANFEGSPILRQLIESQTARTLKLTNKIDIEVRASDFRRLRGLTLVEAICDEVAFFLSDDSANPDSEILTAVRPGLATTSGQLFLISSPYARRGELWRSYQRHFGPNGDPLVLVAQAASRTMNSSLPQSVVERAYERDAASAAAEYGAEFRRDIDSPFAAEAVQSVVERGVYERSPVRGITYDAFIDPSGGSADSFTLGVGHTDRADWQKPVVVVDCLRETKPPFNPSAVAEEFAAVLKNYNVNKIIGDKFAGMWPIEVFAKLSITYEQSAAPKSDLYRDLLPLINSGRIRLLDNAKLISQLVGLERRVARGGRDSIDHGPGGHDDLANAVAGVASISNKYPGYLGGELYDLWAN
jgi:hypothetical protein